MGSELKPCQFCRGPAQSNGIAPGVFISCRVCGTNQNGVFPSEAEAITAWNTRSPSRNDVLEEAAKVAEEKGLNAFRHGHGKKWRDFGEGSTSTADAIRTLKDRDR